MRAYLLAFVAMTLVFFLSVPMIIIGVLRKLYRKESVSDYMIVVAIGFDQVGGSIIYGQEDWTVSSWTWHLAQSGNRYAEYFRVFIDLIFGKNHCRDSFEKEAKELKFENTNAR